MLKIISNDLRHAIAATVCKNFPMIFALIGAIKIVTLTLFASFYHDRLILFSSQAQSSCFTTNTDWIALQIKVQNFEWENRKIGFTNFMNRMYRKLCSPKRKKQRNGYASAFNNLLFTFTISSHRSVKCKHCVWAFSSTFELNFQLRVYFKCRKRITVNALKFTLWALSMWHSIQYCS